MEEERKLLSPLSLKLTGEGAPPTPTGQRNGGARSPEIPPRNPDR